MGIFSSDYKAHGSISNQQLAPQRTGSDTYFGELVLINQRTGDSVADNIRTDIFDGNTSRLRQFFKKGEKYGYTSSYIFEDSISSDIVEPIITADTGLPVSQMLGGFWGKQSAYNVGLGNISRTRDFHEEYHTSGAVQCIGRIDGRSIQGEVADPNVLIFLMDDNTQVNTGVQKSGIATTEGYYASFLSGNKTYYYFSTNQALNSGDGTTIEDVDIFPIIPLQDNGNGEFPYETLPWDDERYDARHRTMRTLGIDFEETSRQVFAWTPEYLGEEWNATYGRQWNFTQRLRNKFPTELGYWEYLTTENGVPDMNQPEWRDYASVWKGKHKQCAKKQRDPDFDILQSDADFCIEFPTEQDYHDSLTEDKEDGGKAIKNITDAHFGLFATAKNLAYSNVVALYATLYPILGLMKKGGGTISNPYKVVEEGGSILPGTGVDVYNMRIESGSFSIRYEMSDFSICRRYGVADPIMYPPGVRNAKYKHSGWDIMTGEPVEDDEDAVDRPTSPPLWEAGSIDFSFEGTRAPDSDEHKTCMELRVQDRLSPDGRTMFLEIRLFDIVAEQYVDVIRDGKHGKAGSATLVGGLENYWSDYDPSDEEAVPYSDVVMFPLTRTSSDFVPLFRRERLIRECAIIRIGAISMEEVKWYQQGWFQIVMIIVALVISYFYPPAGAQLLVEALGVSAGFAGVIITAAIMSVLYLAAKFIDNPYLLAVIQLAAIAYGGFTGTGFTVNPAMMVEATGVVFQTGLAVKMNALKDEMQEWAEYVNEKKKEMREMAEEVGMNDFNKDFMLYLVGLTPPGEDQADFYLRTQSSELPDVTLGKLAITEDSLPGVK